MSISVAPWPSGGDRRIYVVGYSKWTPSSSASSASSGFSHQSSTQDLTEALWSDPSIAVPLGPGRLLVQDRQKVASTRNLRQYKSLPVFIEEDHNDVLPHIHRAIASRHLPMSGIPMVHLDSHPDLLLPLHLRAEDIFAKEKLYNELSIENWILPLVYAGHINDIFWLKPPWADQLSDTANLPFSVGKSKTTGEVRQTLGEPYFLTEALFAPESELTDTKQARLHVITVTPQNWASATDASGDCDSTLKPISLEHNLPSDVKDSPEAVTLDLGTLVKNAEVCGDKDSYEMSQADSKGQRPSEHNLSGLAESKLTEQNNQSLCYVINASPKKTAANLKTGASLSLECSGSPQKSEETISTCDADSMKTVKDNEINAIQTDADCCGAKPVSGTDNLLTRSECENNKPRKRNVELVGVEYNCPSYKEDGQVDLSRQKFRKIDQQESMPNCSDKLSLLNEVSFGKTVCNSVSVGHLQVSHNKLTPQIRLGEQPYILDIDLDFFSTTDPFRNDGSPDQLELLRALFACELPEDKSEKSLLAFSQERERQLDELYSVFWHLDHESPSQSQPKLQDPQRQSILEDLLQSLRSDSSGCQETPPNFGVLFMTGCTFDDTPLPHHISSSQEIDQLMEAFAELLKSLPPPTIITIARSSFDDYCPKDQVDSIQDKVIQVLQATYAHIDIQKLYEQQK